MSFPFSPEFLQSQGYVVKRARKSSASANAPSNQGNISRSDSRDDLKGTVPTKPPASDAMDAATEKTYTSFSHISSANRLACLLSIPSSSSSSSSLSEAHTLLLSGACKVTLLLGKATLNGWQLKLGHMQPLVVPSWMPAVALQHGGFPTTEGVSASNSRKREKRNCDSITIESLLKKYDIQSPFSSSDNINILPSEGTTVCLLESIDDDTLHLDWLLAAEDFPTKNSEMAELCRQKRLKDIAFVKTALVGTQAALQNLSLDFTQLRPSWQHAVDKITSVENDRYAGESRTKDDNKKDNNHRELNGSMSERVIVCGAKGVGKSTCMKYTVNKLLSCNKKVAVIDCDVGQPEFTISGLVSLHIFDDPITMPSHLNLMKPELSYFVGDISTKSEPEMVLKSIESLYGHYIQVHDQYLEEMEELQKDANTGSDSNNVFKALVVPKKSKLKVIKMPLVINTDGWIKYMVSESSPLPILIFKYLNLNSFGSKLFSNSICLFFHNREQKF